MRSLLSILVAGLTVVSCALLAGSRDAAPRTLRIRLVDTATGKPTAGIVRILPEGGTRPLELPGLLSRLQGLGRKATELGWYVVPQEGAATSLPAGTHTLEALSGLETTLTRQTVEVSRDGQEVEVRLPVLFEPEKLGLTAGNTHLHLRNLTLEQADDYLRAIPRADRLAVMFLSYLERHKDDASYITNRYPVGDLDRLAGAGVLFNNGEEHRHNFEGFGQGYGHVMLLDIQKLVRPVSLGPGITGGGFDDIALAPGIAEARRQKGTIVWCHNTNGYEFLPHVLAGRLDALNVFDGSRSGKYEDRYYRCLNIGLRLPLSTGTDWFLYDFSRVYARVEGELSVDSWLAALRGGRAVATNGPLLTLKVDGRQPGATLKLDRPRGLAVEVEARGRQDFQRLELVRNGRVVATVPARPEAGGYVASLRSEVPADEPGWLAARIDSVTRNEMGHELYAHTSPVYIDLEGQSVFQVEDARLLLRELEEAEAAIRGRGTFSSPAARDAILKLYEEATRVLQDRLRRRGS